MRPYELNDETRALMAEIQSETKRQGELAAAISKVGLGNPAAVALWEQLLATNNALGRAYDALQKHQIT